MKLAPYVAVLVSFAAGLAQKWPCHAAGWPYDPSLIFGRLCYSDLPVLLADRGLAQGLFPYATERSFEYPVFIGYLASLTARITASPQGYFLLNLAVLLICTMVTVWATIRLTGRMWAGLIVAVSPVLALTATINWDMGAVMFVSLAMLAWVRERPMLAGLAIGLGVATKFYPILLLFPLLVLAVASRRWKPFLQAGSVALASWLVVNLPVLLLYPAGWAAFWELNSGRGADFGSAYYALQLLGFPPMDSLNLLAIVLFGLCLAAIAVFAPRRFEVLTLLTVAAFLITNKVYSPQYVLWLLPLAVVAGAPLLVLIGWQAAEVLYWWAVWQHLAGSASNETYAASVFLRIAAQAVLCVWVLSRLPMTDTTAAGHRLSEPQSQRQHF